MTADERETLRRLIDQAVRERTCKPNKACAGCGAHHDHHTIGCERCQRRHNNRRRAAVRDRMLAAIGPCVGITPHAQVRLAMSRIRMPRRIH